MNTENNKLVEVVNETGLGNPQAEFIISKFKPLFESAKKLIDESKDLVVSDVSEVEKMKQARTNRLALKDLRVEADNTRKELKEDVLKYGKAVQGVYNLIEEAILPLEEHLMKQEKFAELIEIEKANTLKANRIAEISKYVEDYSIYNFDGMSDEAFTALVASVKRDYDDKIERERIAEEKRLEDEKKETTLKDRALQLAPYKDFFNLIEDELTYDTTEEQYQKMYKFLVQAKKDHDTKQAEIKKQGEKDKKTLDRVLAISPYLKVTDKVVEDLTDEEFSKMLSKAKTDHDKLEEKRIADEKKAEDDKKKLQDDLKKKEDDEKKRLADEKKKEEDRLEAERQAALAPEKDKLTAYAEAIRTIKSPEGLSKAGLEVVKMAEEKLLAISQDIKLKVKEL